MHLVARNAREFAATETGRGLRAIELATSDSNHPIAPEAVLEKIRFGLANEIFLLGVICRIRLHDKPLHEIVFSGAKSRAMAIEIDLVRHVVESPDTVTLSTRERRFRALQFGRIRRARIRFARQVNFEPAKGIAIERDVFAAFAVTCFAGDAEFRHRANPICCP